MKRIHLLIITLILVLAFTSCKNQKNTTKLPAYYLDVLRVKADLTSSSMRSIYNPADFDELEQDILAGKVSSTDCYYRLRKIINKYHVAHVYFVPNEIGPKILPFGFYCYGNEYHIVQTIKKYEKYLGWKVIEIGGLDPVEAVDRIAAFYSYETVIAKKYIIERPMAFDDYKYAGLLDKKGNLQLKFESPEGKTEELRLKAVNVGKYKISRLTPEKENDFLPNFETEKYSIKPCPQKKTLYIPYLSCMAREDYPAEDWFSNIVKELKSGLYDTLVFDLRYNGGGWQLTQGLPEKYKVELNKYNVVLVATGRTFSAATIFMESILQVCPDAKIFGEETGQAIYNYTGLKFDPLKSMNCQFAYPSFLDEISPLTAAKERSDNHYRGIMPDVEVAEDFEVFMQGEDTIYNAIYEYFNQ